MAIRRNFVKEHVDLGTVSIEYCETANMAADVLIKPLLRVVFEPHLRGLGVMCLSVC